MSWLTRIATGSSHSVDLAVWQAEMASIEFWMPWCDAHRPHDSGWDCTWVLIVGVILISVLTAATIGHTRDVRRSPSKTPTRTKSAPCGYPKERTSTQAAVKRPGEKKHFHASKFQCHALLDLWHAFLVILQFSLWYIFCDEQSPSLSAKFKTQSPPTRTGSVSKQAGYASLLGAILISREHCWPSKAPTIIIKLLSSQKFLYA